MIFGDMLKVVEDGFKISKTAMERIGVFNESVCWGVWVRDPRDTEGRKRPHLLISPSHPTVWPYLLRCQIKLRHSPGAMAEAAEILVQNNVNIQFGECAPSGHHHATWNLVAEAVAVRRDLVLEFQKTLANKNPRRLRTFSNRLAARMFEFETILEDALVSAHKAACPEWETMGEEDCGFLHNRVVGQFPLFYTPGRMPAALRKRAGRALPEAVRCRWMQNLAFFSIYGHTDSAVRFQYDEAASTLRVAQGGDLITVVQNALGYSRSRTREYVPSRVQASIHTTEQSLRVEFVPRADIDEKYIRVNVGYQGQFRASGAAAAPDVRTADNAGTDDTTRGLWSSLCQQAARAGVNLVKISNRTTLRDTTHENGSITLIGRMGRPVNKQWMDDTQKDLRTSCAPIGLRDYDVAPRVERLPHVGVFISIRNSMPNQEKLTRLIRHRAMKWGLDPVFVKDPYGLELTREIESKMRECAGLIQVVALSEQETVWLEEKKEVRPDLGWLLFEYGMAGGLGLPRIRMIDRSTWDQSQWKEHLRTNQDEHMVEFDVNANHQSSQQKIDKAMEHLSGRIARGRG